MKDHDLTPRKGYRGSKPTNININKMAVLQSEQEYLDLTFSNTAVPITANNNSN